MRSASVIGEVSPLGSQSCSTVHQPLKLALIKIFLTWVKSISPLPKLQNISEEINEHPTVHRVNWVNGIGYKIIDYISIEIGGTEIDRHTGDFLYLQHELTLSNSKKKNQDLFF